jgi:hypothetical protein
MIEERRRDTPWIQHTTQEENDGIDIEIYGAAGHTGEQFGDGGRQDDSANVTLLGGYSVLGSWCFR